MSIIPLTFLLVFHSIHAWTVHYSCHRSTIILDTTTGKCLLDVSNDDSTAAEKRFRLLWGHEKFHIANNLVTGYLQDSFTGLRRRSDAVGPLDDTLFANLFLQSNKSLSCLNPVPPAYNESINSRKRSFLLTVAYRGSEFCGWQTQPNHNLPSVQQSLEIYLEVLQKTRVDVRVCGRTDAGVHAIGQVCRYRTELDIREQDIQSHLDQSPFSHSLRCLSVQAVSSKFHPGFGATCRAYAYLIDPDVVKDNEVDQLDSMLRELEHKTLDYYGFSYGKVKTQSTECTMYCARAVSLENGGICIQLVGDRFLRRMVRLLVSTAMFQLISGKSSLMPLIAQSAASRDRKLGAVLPAAPPGGLVFVGASFTNM
jgi:tRNA pseudouridine38-40 synthase